MSVLVGRCRVELRPAAARDDGAAAAFARDVRSALPDALGAAFAARPETGIAVVPVLRVSLRGPLHRMRPVDVAREIARVAAAESAAAARAAPGDAAQDAGLALAVLTALRNAESVRVDDAVEAAAWLISLASGERGLVSRVSPFAEWERLSVGAAFARAAAQVGVHALLRALGGEWAQRIAARANDAEAASLLRRLADADGAEPAARTLRDVRAHAIATRERAFSPAVAALLAAIRYTGTPGSAAAARAFAGAGEIGDVTVLESACTGFWLLLPSLARRLGAADESDATAIAFAVAEVLWGARASGDPAIRAFTGERDVDALRERASASGARIGRLAAGILRDFSQTLGPFRRSRCRYVLDAMLRGAGEVSQRGAGWTATLPQSPLRIVLERYAGVGVVRTPWARPALEFVRDRA